MGSGEIEPIYKAFGRILKEHRVRRNECTQEELAQRMGLSRTSVANIENGRQRVALHHLYAIADFLRVTPEALLPSVDYVAEPSWVTDKIPGDMEPGIANWAEKITRE